jgi:hypothetical protein
MKLSLTGAEVEMFYLRFPIRLHGPVLRYSDKSFISEILSKQGHTSPSLPFSAGHEIRTMADLFLSRNCVRLVTLFKGRQNLQRVDSPEVVLGV